MKINIQIALIFILFFCACNKNITNKQVILKIGKLEITSYEFNKNMERDLSGNQGKNNIEENLKKVAQWKKGYLEKCLIISDAYQKRYDTIMTIKKQVDHISKFMMVQQYGYLWKKIISPVVDEFKQVTKDKIEKRKKLFYFDLISCNKLNDLLKVTKNDTVLENLGEFNKLKNKCHFHNFLNTTYISQQWPFLSFWKYKEYLYNLKEGQVTKLLIQDNTYTYLYLDHIENVDITDKDKENLQKELQLGSEKELDDKKTVEMILKGTPVINYKNIDTLLKFISSAYTINEFKDNFELIRYDLNNTTKIIDFKTFLEYYSYLPLKSDIHDKETLLSYINQYYYDDYLNSEAKKLNLYDVDTFLLDQKNFLNNIIYGEYLKRNVFNNIKIDTSEILDYYNKNRLNFTQPRFITVNMYIFNNEQDANLNSNRISDYINRNLTDKSRDTSVIKGLQDFKLDIKIKMEDETEFPVEFLNEVLSIKISSLSTIPFKLKDKYILFFKKAEEGHSIRTLKSAYSQIEVQLKLEKIDRKIQELARELGTKYKIEIDKTGID
jgi:hypothetical protein